MKKCIICNEKNKLEDFYKHPQMKDGRLNKCKKCCRLQSKRRDKILRKNINWVEKERERSREKYHRLNYKKKQIIWDKDKPWKKKSIYKNLSRKFKTPKGFELHHWSYSDNNLEDIVLMDVKSHRSLHSLIDLDLHKKIFFVRDSGKYLNTKNKHLDFIHQSGFTFFKYNSIDKKFELLITND